jgi:phytoene synthase
LDDRAIPAMADAETAAYVGDLVRRGDLDRYWSALLGPDSARIALLALYALNVELARIAEDVSEPHIGLIRLKWWYDAVGGDPAGQAGEGGHPVLDVLIPAAARYGLPADRLAAMVEAREAELDADGFANFEELERYLAATAGAVFELSARILAQGQGVPAGIAPLAHDAALAYGLTGLLRALPWHAAKGRVFLPRSLLAAHGLHPDTIRDSNDNPDLRAALREVAGRAGDALERFRAGVPGLPRALRPAFLPLALTGPYLRKLARPGREPFRDAVQLNPLRRYLLIWWAYLSGRF